MHRGTSSEGPACHALAAAEILARLQGNPGYKNAFTEKVDRWVEIHPQTPPKELLQRAEAVIDRILGERSELSALRAAAKREDWREGVADLRRRLNG